MGEILLIIIMIVLAAKGDYTLVWILGGMLLLLVLESVFGRKRRRSAPRTLARTRIDIPHYFEPDEYACAACGARFRSDTMTCPRCGTRFGRTVTDDRALIGEADFDDWMDELDEEWGKP